MAALGLQSTGYTSTFTNNGSSVLTPGRTRQFRSSDPTAAPSARSRCSRRSPTPTRSGFVFRPDATSSLTVDAYHLEIRDVITITDPLQGAAVVAAFNAAGLNGYTQASYYLNAWDQRTNGIDIIGRKHFKFSTARLDVSLATSFLDTKVSNVNSQVTSAARRSRHRQLAYPRCGDRDPEEQDRSEQHLNSSAGWVWDATCHRFSSYRYNVGNIARCGDGEREHRSGVLAGELLSTSAWRTSCSAT